jgi:hypothetical protein
MSASLWLVADVLDQCGEAGNEMVHPAILAAVFVRARIEAAAVSRFIIQDLKPALWQNLLWQRH